MSRLFARMHRLRHINGWSRSAAALPTSTTAAFSGAYLSLPARLPDGAEHSMRMLAAAAGAAAALVRANLHHPPPLSLSLPELPPLDAQAEQNNA